MTARPRQSPLVPLLLTLSIMGIAGALGLLRTYHHYSETSTSVQAYFITPSEQQRHHQVNLPPPTAYAPIPHLALYIPHQLLPPPELSEIPDELPELHEQSAEAEELPMLPPNELTPPPAATIRTQTGIHSVPARSTTVPPTPPATTQVATTPPAYLHAPPPDYPAALRSSRRSGSVRVRIHINQQGLPVAVDILSDAHPQFIAAARKRILSSWKFRPATRNGKAIESAVTTTIHFTLR